MFEKLDESRGSVFGCRFSGTVTDPEFKAFAAETEKLIAAHGKISLLILVDYPQDFDLKAAWDDVVFWIRHVKELTRLAIVGQSTWQKRMESVERFLLHTEIRYYDTAHIADAWAWLQEKTPVRSSPA